MKAMRPVLLAILCTLSIQGFALDRVHGIADDDTTGLTTLPVRWLEFSLIQNEHSVSLKWSTLHEQGIKIFRIERSDKGNDFRQIGSVVANGNSSKIQEYYFEDTEPLPGHSYYRISCEDENGFKTISIIRKVHYTKSKHPIELRNVYVNRKAIHFSPVLNHRNQPRLFIYSRTGRLAFSTTVNSYTTQVDLSSLQAGIYYLSTGYQVWPVILVN